MPEEEHFYTQEESLKGYSTPPEEPGYATPRSGLSEGGSPRAAEHRVLHPGVGQGGTRAETAGQEEAAAKSHAAPRCALFQAPLAPVAVLSPLQWVPCKLGMRALPSHPHQTASQCCNRSYEQRLT